jgi:hypothetical protein
MNKFSQLAAAESRHLLIAAFEASGAFGRGVQHILRLCALRVNQAAFDESAAERTWASRQFRPYWDQRIACGFWRGSYQMYGKNTKALQSQSMLAALSSVAADELYEHSHAVPGGQASRGFHQPPPLVPHSVPSSAPRRDGEAPPPSF